MCAGTLGPTNEVITIGCNCSGPGAPSTKYELELPDGTKRVFLTEAESRVALATSGGQGIIRVVR